MTAPVRASEPWQGSGYCSACWPNHKGTGWCGCGCHSRAAFRVLRKTVRRLRAALALSVLALAAHAPGCEVTP